MHSSTPTALPVALPRQHKIAITVLVLAAFVVILNETIMGVALPRLMSDLDISAAIAQWLTTAFLLTMAIIIPITGQLLQRFSTRTVFVGAMTLFSIGTFISAMAPGIGVLLVGRVIQAAGTAIMMPLLMTTVMNLVPAERRGSVMGLISIVMSVAPAVGPTVSGVILKYLTWRWMFWAVLPIALAALAYGLARMPNVSEARNVKVDAGSVVLSAAGFGGLVYGLSAFGESANTELAINPWLPTAAGLVCLTLFVLLQLRLQKTDAALLDLRIFKSSNFSVAIVMMVFACIALFGTIILLPIYLQSVQGLDTLQTGLLMLPGSIAMGLLGPVIGRLFDAFGPRPLVIPGAVLVSGVLWGFTFLTESTDSQWILALHISLSVGLGMLFTPMFTTALSSLPQRLYSYGSATISTLQQVAAAAGTALFIAVMSIVAARQAGAGAGSAGAESPAALMAGIHGAFLIGAVLSLVLIGLAFFLRRVPTIEAPSEPQVEEHPDPILDHNLNHKYNTEQ